MLSLFACQLVSLTQQNYVEVKTDYVPHILCLPVMYLIYSNHSISKNETVFYLSYQTKLKFSTPNTTSCTHLHPRLDPRIIGRHHLIIVLTVMQYLIKPSLSSMLAKVITSGIPTSSSY